MFKGWYLASWNTEGVWRRGSRKVGWVSPAGRMDM
jgi:hypothetical protein